MIGLTICYEQFGNVLTNDSKIRGTALFPTAPDIAIALTKRLKYLELYSSTNLKKKINLSTELTRDFA